MLKNTYELDLKYCAKYKLEYEYEILKQYYSNSFFITDSYIVPSKKFTKRKKCLTKSCLSQ